jgi:hypothetical protein
MAYSTAVQRDRHPSSLYDVVDLILDKGLVIDAYVRVSLIGIEILTIDARIVVASVDTYLRFAEAVNRLDLTQTGARQLPEVVEDMSSGVSRGKASGVLDTAKEAVSDVIGGDDDEEKEPARRRRRSSRSGE